MAFTKSKSITEKVSEAAEHAKDSDLVHKLFEDPAIREQASKALHSLQDKAGELQKSQKKITKKAEKKLSKAQKKEAAAEAALAAKIEANQAAADAAAEAAKKSKKKRHPVRKLLVVATLGAIVALVVSEDARKAVLDGLFGAEEEFEYTSAAASSPTSNGAS
ncbi:MAG: hypothetical protein QM648_08325 [Solirubrobacterales bacterium]